MCSESAKCVVSREMRFIYRRVLVLQISKGIPSGAVSIVPTTQMYTT